jgi:hypothetical protein
VSFAAACGSGGNDDGGGGGGNPPTSIVVASGNFQSARYGPGLPTAPTFLVSGRSGPLAGVTVTFAAQAGGGSLDASSAVTNASGVASLPAFTLGPAPGENRVRATAGTVSADLVAIATAGPPSSVVIEAGNNQNWVEKSLVPVRPAVRVTDGTFGVAGVPVIFAVTGGNGTVSIPQVNSNADGIATVGGWRLGDVGANTLSATVNGIPTPVTFTATAAALQVTAVNRVSGDGQVGFFNNYPGSNLVVEVLNQFNQPAEGVPVTFAVTSGGGSLVRAVDTTKTNGRASLGSWRFGPGGAQAVSATAATTSTTFNATVSAAPASQFNIEVRYLSTPPSATVQAAFSAAAARWAQVIVGDLPDNTGDLALVTVNFGGQVGVTTCSPALSGAAAQIDDLVIFADVRTIDGSGGILGGATDARNRGGVATGTTITGCMIFDAADIDDLISEGVLGDVILHEMGHVLGIGSKWPDANFLVGNCPAGSSVPYYTASAARQAFLGSLTTPTTFTDSIVPVEGSTACVGGQSDGTRDSHWRESTLDTELMTGFVDVPGPNPLSAITAASLRDLGYVVNDAASDSYSLLRAPALRAPGRRIKLQEVDLTGRRQEVDARGNVTRTW